MSNEHPPRSSSEQEPLIVSDDSLYNAASSEPMCPPIMTEGVLPDSGAVGFSSEDLIPHPSSPPDSKAMSTTMFASSTGPPETPNVVHLTAEIFASGAIPSGTMLGHFMIKSYIGGGGMGRVYLAHDSALDRLVAVKVLPRQRANDRGTVARFMNEAKSAARLNHEHIAQVYFAGEQDGIPYIVFEYVEGTNIRAMVDDFDAFPLPQALNYLIQIAHALAHAALHGVVHRDVKPSNILITREGRAKLIDMGLARLLDPSDTKDDLTASGVTLGTFDYISPEQARDPRNADIRSDIYSLGCTFFFMLSGRPPFPEGTVLQKLLQHQGDEPPDIRSFQPNIPTEVASLLQKMMAKDPKQRFQTPDALIESLVHVAKMLGLQPTGPGKLIWEMSPPSKTSQFLKHIPWIAALGLLLAVYFPLNLYWRQTATRTDWIPQLPVDELPAEQLETTVKTSSSLFDVGPGKVGDGKEIKTELRPVENRGRLSFVSFSPGRHENLLTELVFPKSDASFSFAASWPEENVPGMGLAPAAIRESWSPFVRKAAMIDLSGFSKDSKPVDPSLAASGAQPVSTTPTIRCVDPSGKTPASFPDLASALAEADKGAVLELKWNDAFKIDPMALTGRQLTFVAAKGFAPVLLFEPSDSSAGTSPNSRSMMTTSSCDLEFRDLSIEMRIRPDVLASRWTLFELIGKNTIKLSRCVVTIRNAAPDRSSYHQEVAFFRNNILPSGFDQYPINTPDWALSSTLFGAGSFEDVSVFGDEPTGGLPIPDGGRSEIRVNASVLRGEATGMQCDVPQAVEFLVENSMIALAEPFVRAEDSKRTVVPDTVVRIRFDHVTFYGRKAFARQFRDSFVTEPLRLEIEARSSIFFLDGAPLADFRGARLVRDALDAFKWTGQTNYFQGITLGLKMRPSSTSSDGGVTYEMPISEWKEKINPIPEKDPKRSTRIDRLSFEEVRKPVNRMSPIDLRTQFAPDFVPETGDTPPGFSENQIARPSGNL